MPFLVIKSPRSSLRFLGRDDKKKSVIPGKALQAPQVGDLYNEILFTGSSINLKKEDYP